MGWIYFETVLNKKWCKIFFDSCKRHCDRGLLVLIVNLTIRRILEGVRAKKLLATLLFVYFTKAFDSIHRGKMEQILLAYGLPKETVAAITILHRNTKMNVRSPDGDTEYFEIVEGVLQGDTLAPYLFIICLEIRSTKSEKMASSWQRKEAEGTPQKQ